jgi:hypothetical protein
MEKIDGEDLETYRLRKGGKLPVEEFLPIATKLLDGLNYLHEQGVVHLDIKPQNIMVSNSGQVKVTDYGISKTIKEQLSSRDGSMTVVGTLCFMAPEQLRGSTVYDRRTDIYAVGIMFHLLLSGRYSFPMTTREVVVRWHLDEKHAGDRWDIGVNLGNIIHKAMSVEPNQRYLSCEELLMELRNFGRAYSEAKSDLIQCREDAEQGDVEAQQKLGTSYYAGHGVPVNQEEGIKWLSRAAKRGNAEAQLQLGWAYKDGTGVTADRAEAEKWLRKAADQGHETAAELLEELGMPSPLTSRHDVQETALPRDRNQPVAAAQKTLYRVLLAFQDYTALYTRPDGLFHYQLQLPNVPGFLEQIVNLRKYFWKQLTETPGSANMQFQQGGPSAQSSLQPQTTVARRALEEVILATQDYVALYTAPGGYFFGELRNREVQSYLKQLHDLAAYFGKQLVACSP